jgi:hypothetical protein
VLIIKIKRDVGKGIQFVGFLALFSCLSQVNFPVEIIGGQLVVSGQISTIADQNIIELGTSANSEKLPNPLSGASIKLIDNFGTVNFYTETSLGKYSLANIAGIVGRTYYIEIQTPNGRLYKSLPEKMPVASTIDSVSYEIVNEGVVDFEGVASAKNFYKIYAHSTLASKNVYLKWSVNEAFLLSPTDFPDILGNIPPPCFILQNADPQRIVLADGSAFFTNKIKGQLVASREIDWTFLEKHYFTTYQSSITKEAFEYWRKVNILSNQVGSIFDAPPAEITGNIIGVSNPSEKIVGFFQTSNQALNRFYVLPQDLPFKLLILTCAYQGDFNGNTLAGFDTKNYPVRCIDCLSVRNSSYKRPSWF